MKDHEKRELVSRITAVALEYRAAEQLRERIGEAVLPAIDAAEAAERERWIGGVRVHIPTETLEQEIQVHVRRAVLAERERCAAKAGEYAQAWWSKHCASNKHMETTRAAEAMERKAFEAWISAPPFEQSVRRYSDSPRTAAWPGNYREYSVQLAWCAWKARAAHQRCPTAG